MNSLVELPAITFNDFKRLLFNTYLRLYNDDGIDTQVKFREVLLKTFDSWGLAFSLRKLVDDIWPEIHGNIATLSNDNKIILEVYKLLDKMIDYNYYKRLKIDEALEKLNSIIRTNELNVPEFVIPEVSAAVGAGRRRTTRRKKLKSRRASKKARKTH